MTTVPHRLLTIDEYTALGETPAGYTELMEGRLITTPGPSPRIDKDHTMIRADEVAVVIEIVSPGSRRTDYRVKHDEYADAGIPHYWIIDLTEPVSLVACRGYQDAAAVTGTFATDVPFPVKLDLDALLS
ncbi:Uma2 family endonuclease [Amycolatopsis sp. NBC_00355]|uniref:Uma2 family endonuclease n=1 Tax=Amycolatopsis sp. NBC_00355 TaxID=2975957 RepID=UPI002E25955E